MNYQKPTMSPVDLQTEAASCSPCILLTISPPKLLPPVSAEVTVGDQVISVSTDGVAQPRPIVVTSPTSGGCPSQALPGLPSVGPLDGIVVPGNPVIIDLPRLPPAVADLVAVNGLPL